MQFYWVLTRYGRLPNLLRRAPVNAFNQQCKLNRREVHGATGINQSWPDKAALVELLGEQAKPVAVPEQHLHG